MATRHPDLDRVPPYKASRKRRANFWVHNPDRKNAGLIKRQHPRAACDANVHKHRHLALDLRQPCGRTLVNLITPDVYLFSRMAVFM